MLKITIKVFGIPRARLSAHPLQQSTTSEVHGDFSAAVLLLDPIICAMSAASALAKNYPVADGYWREISKVYAKIPTTTSHLTFTVKPVAEVEVGALVLLPMPDAVPEQVPSTEEIFHTYLLWCKVVGKQESSGGTDLLVDVVGGRESFRRPQASPSDRSRTCCCPPSSCFIIHLP
jgi:hypothetical protein